MYASWARASRSAALRATHSRLATRSDRSLHASAAARAAADAHNPNNAPQDGDDKPKDNETGEAGRDPTADDKLIGEKGLNNSGEARGRQKRVNGSARSRASRRKAPEELPPVHLPASFREHRVYRHGDLRQDELSTLPADPDQAPPLDAASQLQRTKELLQKAPSTFTDRSSTTYFLFEVSAWNETELQGLRDETTPDNLKMAVQRNNVMLHAAWRSVIQAASVFMVNSPSGVEDFTKSLQEMKHFQAGLLQKDKMKLMEMAMYYTRRTWPLDLEPERTAIFLKNILPSKIRFTKALGLVHQDALLEATSSIRADFAIKPPKNIKVAELKRPITILHFPYCKGFAWPKYIMQEIAADVGADMVHITAQDIAQIAGTYLGQDTTRAPGPLSLLGDRAAEHAGILHRRAPEKSDEDLSSEVAFSIMMHGAKPKKEGKKKLSIMDYFLGEPSRGKSDEVLVDLKINAVLEELVHSASSYTSDPRPLIIHVHDINALNMDEECGSAIMGKLRKIVDDLWIEGRKVVLVGTCSSLDAPMTYKTALKELKNSERLITLHRKPVNISPAKAKDGTPRTGTNVKAFMDRLDQTFSREVMDENAKTITTVLETLLGSDADGGAPRVEFNLHEMSAHDIPLILTKKLLAVTEVYRTVKTMIGLRRQHPDIFDQVVLEEALLLIDAVDEEDDQLYNNLDRIRGEVKRNLISDPDRPSPDYERGFLSSLINPNDIKTTFKDIHAPKETLESIKMLTQLSLLRPEAFAYGVLATDRIPGCLLYGPPGTGKTLLAKAVAKESGAHMIEVSGASINQKYVGEGEKNVKALFSLAKKKEPLVIFIDEADALLGARGGRNDAAGRRDVINQFLREWDGMETSKAFIMVATNRPFDLDEAVLRRLPRKLLVDLPLEADRAAILRIHLKNEALDDTVSIEEMAKQTALYSGSDLKNVCVAAAMAAVKEELEASEKHTGPERYVWPKKRILNRRHFDKAVAEIPAGASEDMATLNAIKKFDERYGEKTARRKRRGMGFEVIPEATDSHEARVRSGEK